MPGLVTSLESPSTSFGHSAIIFPGEVGHIDLDGEHDCKTRRVLFACCDVDDRCFNVYLVTLPSETDLGAYKEDAENIVNDGVCVVEATDETKRVDDKTTGYVYEFKHFSSMIGGYCVNDFI
jgi:hypothetical protein